MADEPTNPAPLGEIEHGPSKFEQFLDQNQKKLIIGLLVVVAAVSAYIVIDGMKETEDNSAGEALAAAANPDGSGYDIGKLRDVMEKFTDSPAAGSAMLLLADEQWKDNRRDESIKTVEEFLAKNPVHPGRGSARLSLAIRLLEQEKTEEAVKALQDVVDAPDSRHVAPFALLTLGDLKKKAGDDEAAKAFYEQARDKYPANSPSIGQFANERIALLGVQPPVKIAPPPVPEPSPPTPPGVPNPRPTVPPGMFPELVPTPTPTPTPAPTPAPTPPAPTPTPTDDPSETDTNTPGGTEPATPDEDPATPSEDPAEPGQDPAEPDADSTEPSEGATPGNAGDSSIPAGEHNEQPPGGTE